MEDNNIKKENVSENSKEEVSFKDLVETLHANGMMYFYLVSLISADTLVSAENCEKSIYQLNLVIESLADAEIPDVDKEKYLDYCKKGIEICENDKKNFLKNIN